MSRSPRTLLSPELQPLPDLTEKACVRPVGVTLVTVQLRARSVMRVLDSCAPKSFPVPWCKYARSDPRFPNTAA